MDSEQEIDVTPYQERLNEVEGAIADVDRVRERNEFLASHDTDDLAATIESLEKSARILRTDIMTGVDTPMQYILQKEQDYNSAVESLSYLVMERTYLERVSGDISDEAYDLLLREVEDLNTTIQEAKEFDNIGEKGVYPLPGLKYKVNSEFGTRWDPVTQSNYQYHQGTDLYAPSGSKVVAVYSGVVHAAGNSYNSGNYIYLDHGEGVMTFYCHLSEIKVEKGQEVHQGDLIALSGNTGARTTGFGVYIDKTPREPRKLLEW